MPRDINASFLGMSMQEMQEVTGVKSLGTVLSRLSNCRKELKENDLMIDETKIMQYADGTLPVEEREVVEKQLQQIQN